VSVTGGNNRLLWGLLWLDSIAWLLIAYTYGKSKHICCHKQIILRCHISLNGCPRVTWSYYSYLQSCTPRIALNNWCLDCSATFYWCETASYVFITTAIKSVIVILYSPWVLNYCSFRLYQNDPASLYRVYVYSADVATVPYLQPTMLTSGVLYTLTLYWQRIHYVYIFSGIDITRRKGY